MTSNTRLDELKANGRLPSPKGAALQVLLLSQKEDVTNQQVAHAIQADPALSARMIKLANSPVAHQIRPIASVVDAVTVLGLNTVRQMVLGLSLVDSSRNMPCKKFDYHNFWSRSLLTAITAHNLVSHRSVGAEGAEQIFVLGLLARVGSLALATAYPIEYAAILEKIAANADSKLVELERAEFGFDHNLLSKEMLADWRMPNIFQLAVLHCEDPEKSNLPEGSRDWYLLHLLHIADYLSKMCLAQEPVRIKMVSKLIFKATRLGVESDVLSRLGDKAVKEWHEWSKLFGIRVVTVPPFERLLEVAPLAPESTDAGELPGNISTSYRLRILLVDDDRAVLMIMKMLLDSSGHTVAIARNGIEALGMVENFMPQVIITDWHMPEMDGIEFCKALRRNPAWRNIYVFMMTSQESTERLVEAFEAGANDYLTKPINPKVLGARLSAGQRVVQLQEELEHEREQLHKFSSELAISNQRLQQLALTDPLTNLPNRRFANEHLERQWALAQRNSSPLSCMMVDIDYFKQVNDTYGHKIGDDVLKQVAHALQLSVRKEDVVCRLGGEEFLVICSGLQTAVFYRHAERLRQNIAELVFSDPASGKSFKLTISIGGASKTPAMSTSDMLLQLADKRLYTAKEKGRNRTVAD
jgi:two-component system, cell cycle response regulator